MVPSICKSTLTTVTIEPAKVSEIKITFKPDAIPSTCVLIHFAKMGFKLPESCYHINNINYFKMSYDVKIASSILAISAIAITILCIAGAAIAPPVAIPFLIPLAIIFAFLCIYKTKAVFEPEKKPEFKNLDLVGSSLDWAVTCKDGVMPYWFYEKEFINEVKWPFKNLDLVTSSLAEFIGFARKSFTGKSDHGSTNHALALRTFEKFIKDSSADIRKKLEEALDIEQKKLEEYRIKEPNDAMFFERGHNPKEIKTSSKFVHTKQYIKLIKKALQELNIAEAAVRERTSSSCRSSKGIF